MDKENNCTKKTIPSASFIWTFDETTKAFPIDYSINELVEKENWPYQAIREHLFRNPLLQDTLNQANGVSQTKNTTSQNPGKISLPVEAMPFFKSFFALRKSPNYKALRRKHNSIQQTKENMRLFTIELCRKLYNEVCLCPSNSENHTSYCRQALFENNTFVSVILNDLWETEIEKRINALKALLGNAETKLQLEVLSECLLSLDQCIARFSKQTSKPSAKENENQPIQAMLKQILSARHKMRQKNTTTRYRIPNGTFISPTTKKEENLRKAFTEINNHFKPVGNQYMAAARNSYLQQLASLHPSSTEHQFKNITDYLSQPALPVDQFRSKLVKWTEDWCDNVINSCVTTKTVAWNTPSFDLSHHGYEGVLITKLAHTSMVQLLKQFDDTIHIIQIYRFLAIYTAYNGQTDDMRMKLLAHHVIELGLDPETSDSLFSAICQTFASQIFPTEQEKNTNFCYDHAKEFLAFLKAACTTLLGDVSSCFNEDGTVNVSVFAKQFSSAATTAAEAFRPGSGQLFSVINIEPHLENLNIIVSHPDKCVRFEIFLFACIPLLDGILFQLLRRIQADCIENTINAIYFIDKKTKNNI